MKGIFATVRTFLKNIQHWISPALFGINGSPSANLGTEKKLKSKWSLKFFKKLLWMTKSEYLPNEMLSCFVFHLNTFNMRALCTKQNHLTARMNASLAYRNAPVFCRGNRSRLFPHTPCSHTQELQPCTH